MVKNPPTNAGESRDVGLDPWIRKTPLGGNSNPLQYSRLGNPMDRGAWWAGVHGVSKSQTHLSTHAQSLFFHVYAARYGCGEWIYNFGNFSSTMVSKDDIN